MACESVAGALGAAVRLVRCEEGCLISCFHFRFQKELLAAKGLNADLSGIGLVSCS